MNHYINFVTKRPLAIIIFLIAVTIAMLAGIPKLQFDNSVEAFLPQTDPEYVFYNKSKDIYGDNSRFFIIKVTSEDLFSQKSLKLFDDFVSDLEEYETFNPNLEKKRIEKFNAIIAKKDISGEMLLKPFAGDSVFSRNIERALTRKLKIPLEKRLTEKEKETCLKYINASYEMRRHEMVETILSPFTVSDISGADNTLEPYDLVKTGPDNKRLPLIKKEDIDQFKSNLKKNPSFKQGIYCTDKKTSEITDFAVIVKFINLKNQDAIAQEMLDIVQLHQTKGLDIMPQGSPVINIWFNNYMRRDIRVFLPFVIMVVVIVFFLNFRTVSGVFLPLSTLGMALIWVLGLMGYLGAKITAVGISLPPLMVAVGSSYSIHILNQFYTDKDMIANSGLRKGVARSMEHITTTVLLAGLTTFVAFMTLATSQLTAIRDWGIFSAIGVFAAVFISCSLIPAGLVLMGSKTENIEHSDTDSKSNWVNKIVMYFGHLSVNHPKVVVMAVVIVLIFSAVGIRKLNVESEFLQYFKENDYIRTSAKVVEDKFGGRWGFDILIDSGKTNGVKDPEFLSEVEKVRQWLTDPENTHLDIGRTDAFTDIIKTMHKAMNNDNPDYYKIPSNKDDIWDYLEIYSDEDDNGDGRIDSFEAYVDPDFRVCNILARLKGIDDKHLGSSVVERILRDVRRYLSGNVPSKYSARVTGFPVMYVKMAYHIVHGQFSSLILSFGIIAVIVTLLFCDLKAGFISLIPMGVAVTINFGIMGWVGINLDTVTSVIAAITIGIGVDDTIHFLNTFRYFRSSGLSIDRTLEKTLDVSGTAIVYTSLALILGFSVLTLSSFKPVILFGLLMGLTMFATTIGALLILPAVLKLTGVKFVAPGMEEGIYKYISLGKVFGLQHENL